LGIGNLAFEISNDIGRRLCRGRRERFQINVWERAIACQDAW
jgi:hypothetical protein